MELSNYLFVLVLALFSTSLVAGARSSKDLSQRQAARDVVLGVRTEQVLGDKRTRKSKVGVFDDEEKKDEEVLEEIEKDVELIEKLETTPDNRDSRGLLKSAAFLAGMKFGGFIQNSGTLAASNSLRVFGKVLNTALSVSYGNLENLADVPQVAPHNDPGVVHSDTPSDTVLVGQNGKYSPGLEPIQTTTDVYTSVRHQFLKSHNNVVQRINQKFFKDKFTARDSG